MYHNVSDERKTKRKERVLHTRVSEKLDEELREKAAGLGVSVSNLVRNILLNTVELVEDIVADSSSVVRAAGNKPGAPIPIQQTVLGWQTLRLNLNAVCSACNAILTRGSEASIAVPTSPTAPVFRCVACLPTPEADEE